jgi:hypothetical protein
MGVWFGVESWAVPQQHPPPNLQKRWGHVLTDPARSGREAPRAKRALRKNIGISMPFCLIPCRLLALSLSLGLGHGPSTGRVSRANRLSGARFARTAPY